MGDNVYKNDVSHIYNPLIPDCYINHFNKLKLKIDNAFPGFRSTSGLAFKEMDDEGQKRGHEQAAASAEKAAGDQDHRKKRQEYRYHPT